MSQKLLQLSEVKRRAQEAIDKFSDLWRRL